MKRKIALLMTIALALLLSACGKAESKPVSIDDLKTMADIYALKSKENQYAYDATLFVYVFSPEDKYYRAIADIDNDTYNAIWDLDLREPNYDDKVRDLTKSLTIRTIEDISQYVLSEEDRNALIGTTGAALLDEGWISNGFDLENNAVYMNFAYFRYKVTFEEPFRTTDSQAFDDSEDIKQLKVKSVEFSGLGFATKIL